MPNSPRARGHAGKGVREAGLRAGMRKNRRFAIAIVVLIITTGLIINFVLNQPSITQPESSTKAALVDQLSLTQPNPAFAQAATAFLQESGYTVDYYSGEKVTVDFYRNLPSFGYGLIILRVHSTATWVEGKPAPVILFTSEPYSTSKHVYEQLTDQLEGVAFSAQEQQTGGGYFGITPKFVTDGMKGSFQNTVVMMMGCQGLDNEQMAKAFTEKGARIYAGWKGWVLSERTDSASKLLLQNLIREKSTVRQAVQDVMSEIGPDPLHGSILSYYPFEAGDFTIRIP